jgi:hypothetical protein
MEENSLIDSKRRFFVGDTAICFANLEAGINESSSRLETLALVDCVCH